MAEPVLQVQDAFIRYGAAAAVSGVSLAVGENEVVALLGANGAGKSTLLKAVSGLIPLASGSVRYLGRNLAKVPGHQRARDGIAHVPEGRRIFSTFTVRENLLMGAYSRRGHEVETRLQGVFERFPILAERRNQAGGSLSGGEQQMLAIGRALMSGPRLLLLDEPSLGLSPIAITTVFEAIRKVREEGVSMLLVEQNSTLALEVADRACILRTGKVVLEGGSAEIRSQERLLRAYLGSPGKSQAAPGGGAREAGKEVVGP
ncbi:MAG: ABC transporter ATP-binding protein [Holophaga sp.]|jgi:branched-chain amino acid transport system ATP-binding protein